MLKLIQPCLLTSVLFLTACGSGDGSFGDGDGEIVIPVPTKISGVWTGSTRDSSSGLTEDSPILIFTTSDGAIRLVTLEFAIQARGSIDTETIVDDFSGTADFMADLLAFAPQGFFFGDNIETVSCLADIKVVGKKTLEGAYNCIDSDKSSGIFRTDYSLANDTLASSEIVSGTWTSNDQSLSITVDSDGNIVGTLQTPNLVSCSWTGQVTPIAEDNLYNLSFNLAAGNCGSFAGDYSGLGTIFEIDGAQDRLVFQADSGRIILANELFSNQ